MQELRLLGPVEVHARDGSVHTSEPRRLAVLTALTVDAGRLVPTTTLIDRVWGDDPPGQAVRTLGTYIARIRRTLEESFSDPAVTVVNQAGGYRLTVGRDQIDLFRFRDLVVEARRPARTPQERVDLLRQAVALHRGDPLTGVAGTWATRTREHLIGELLTARADWADAEVAVGNAPVVLAPLSALADGYPLAEPLMVALVRALVAVGRPTEALERCRLHQVRLADEYGTDPSPQLTTLYETVLRGDRQLVAMPKEQSEVSGLSASTGPQPATPVEAETVTAGAEVERRRWRLMAAVAFCTTLAVAFGAVRFWPSDRPAHSGPSVNGQVTATEDFSGTALEPTQWAAHQTRHENGSSWSPAMVRVRDGELQIRASGRSPVGRGNMAGSVCWCLERGIVRTFGVWEVRAKFDVGAGYAPMIGLYSGVAESTPGWGFLTMARLDDGERRSMYPVVRGAGGRPIDGAPVSGDFTAWNTYSIEWRADFVTVSLNGVVILDTREMSVRVTIPTTPMFLYVQVVPGPEGAVPAPNQETPNQVATYVDWVRYAS
ncbi:BTAD domain-containing putative transcriptional regulator [Actinoplanes sp. NPDC051346]|uniref:BTAD domain-containing putative transcriptional regulator n=1 Tax=Actinoplanes sp. NPDC051346 TaxID=3155048 RepID=UPI00343BAA1E